MNNNLLTVCLAFLMSQFLCGCNSDKQRYVSEDLRNTSLEILRETLHNSSSREKVHAAEFLLNLGYRNVVHEVFTEELSLHGQEYFYRIGIWRVMAQASVNPSEKQEWIDSIGGVFKDTASPDRIHAAESLAKLGVSPFTISDTDCDSILSGEINSLYIYTLWGAAHTSSADNERIKSQLTEIASGSRNNSTARMQAAYALRFLGDAGSDNWHVLMKEEFKEADTSPVYPYLLSSALVNTPVDSMSSPRVKYCRQKLNDYLSNKTTGNKYELLNALAEKGDQDDAALLSGLITFQPGVEIPDNRDIRSASANALLRIDRRQKYTLHEVDWVIVAIYGLCMLLIGWMYSRKTKNTEDYLLGGRKMRPIAVGLSLFATMLSSLSYLSYPGEMIQNGPVFFIGMIIFPFIYYIVGWFLIPRFMEMKVTSAYELLEVRLGLNVRILATFFFLSLRFLWMATIIYATINTALVAIADISPQITPYISVLLMLFTMIYTSIGGFKAVVTTDVIQSIVLWGGAFLTLVLVTMHFNSLTTWLPDQYLSHWSPVKWGFNIQERATVGNAMVMLFVWFVCTNGSDQMAVQRYLSTKNIRAARHTFGISLIATFVVKIFLALVGLAMIAYFSENPHFLGDGESIIEQADRLFPKFILIGLPVGISGLVASGIFAAAMSSLSSGLNSSSSVIQEDIVKRLMPRFVSANPLRQVKLISLFVGVIAILISLAIGGVQGNLLDVVIKVVNLFVAPLFVLFFMAIFIPFATGRGTVIGGILSVIVAVAAAFYEFMGIQVLWIMPSALITGIITGILASIFDRVIRNQG